MGESKSVLIKENRPSLLTKLNVEGERSEGGKKTVSGGRCGIYSVSPKHLDEAIYFTRGE